MTLLERLQSHKGGLIRLKTELFWYGRGWDRSPGRICLILDAAPTTADDADTATVAATATLTGAADPVTACSAPEALLLIDDRPQWIWVAEDDVEVLDDPS